MENIKDKKNILIVTHIDFYNRRYGSHYRLNDLVDYLSEYYSVTILLITNENIPRNIPVKIISLKNYLAYERIITFFIKTLIKNSKRLDYWKNLNRKRHIRFLSKLLDTYNFDILITEYIFMHYIVKDYLYRFKTTILDTHDIISLRNESYLKYGFQPKTCINIDDEISVFNSYDKVVFIQKEEYIYAKNIIKSKAMLVPCSMKSNYGIYDARVHTVSEDDNLIIGFIGSSSDFNIHAINWFIDNVWNEKLNDIFELHIFGDVCKKINVSKHNIHKQGYQRSIDRIYSGIDIVINPVMIGSGLKIKNIEAMSFGVPLITTTKGAEGIGDSSLKAFIIANNPDEFMDGLMQLRDKRFRSTISKNSLKYIEDNFGYNTVYSDFKQFLDAT